MTSKKEHQKTSSTSAFETSAQHIPRDIDIICGKRGNANARHPGNVKFSQLIKATMGEYIDGASRIQRTLVVADIVSRLRSNGVKFLKFDPITNGYFELSTDLTHQKVGHAIRDQIKKLESKKSAGPMKASTNAMLPTTANPRRRHSDPIPSNQLQDTRTVKRMSSIACCPPAKTKTSCPSNSLSIEKTREERQPRRTTIGDVKVDLSIVLFELGRDVQELSTDQAMSAATSVTSLGPGDNEDMELWDPLADTTESHVPCEALLPLPLSSNDKFQVDDIEAVCQMLA